MKCIAGLGNPGRKYAQTRHNIGFITIDELLHRNQWKLEKEKFHGLYTIGHMNGEKVLLLKPLTFMNASGEAIRPLLDYYEIAPQDLLVIYDDLDLPAGKVRLRQKGGHGGHNGVRSTIDQLKTKEFNRLRIGIGRPSNAMPVVDYVLGKFHKEELPDVVNGIKRAADACEAWMQTPFSQVMNEYNQ
ncbi:aminoacyl-tRNA hydrolase [Virgibacillus sp. 179-BFC.A HS]|uniref:Peptidyl-tRNA hydrolase n=1 Tax=Tigheibacillus jepli TaxID=3035914 RepID=A0ABU5CCI5_9BACI|nr:aminoacyl-tRNA hydrolase [Virgibacillus sp. 179-BFC.A HS]MDY0404042.1 aminoacyl-tRNA hydrolase [Virgibacillus sp. 179-BFC.A HS]